MTLDDLDLDAGQFRHRVTLQSYAHVSDASGQLQPTWSDEATFWAFIKPLSGRELANAQQIKAEVSHAIISRYNPDLTFSPKLRLTYESRVFGIHATVNVQERGIKRVTYCTEQVSPT